jgi:hypothetical protein
MPMPDPCMLIPKVPWALYKGMTDFRVRIDGRESIAAVYRHIFSSAFIELNSIQSLSSPRPLPHHRLLCSKDTPRCRTKSRRGNVSHFLSKKSLLVAINLLAGVSVFFGYDQGLNGGLNVTPDYVQLMKFGTVSDPGGEK